MNMSTDDQGLPQVWPRVARGEMEVDHGAEFLSSPPIGMRRRRRASNRSRSPPAAPRYTFNAKTQRCKGAKANEVLCVLRALAPLR
jgi:hypothetical protein